MYKITISTNQDTVYENSVNTIKKNTRKYTADFIKDTTYKIIMYKSTISTIQDTVYKILYSV